MRDPTITLMDGSMGEVLADRGFSTRDGLWSAQALLDYPDEVKELHKEYLAAGSEIITTNTYSTIPSYLEKAGMRHRVRELTAFAARLARQSIEEHGDSSRRVAGCLPPLGESYRPDLVPPAHVAIPVYHEMVEAMDEWVDLFLAETMSSIDEAVHVAEALNTVPNRQTSDWMVAFTLDDRDGTVLRSGERVTKAIECVSEFEPIAILFNCATPESILAGITEARKATDTRIGGYPNRFRPVPENWTLDNEQEIVRNEGLDEEAFSEWSKKFVLAGASYLGGCCGIGPTHIGLTVLSIRQRFASSVSI